MEAALAQLQVTETRVSIIKGGTVVGNVSVSFANGICVRQIKVVKTEDGYIVKMPTYKSGETHKNYVFGLTKELNEALKHAVIEAYTSALAKQEGK